MNGVSIMTVPTLKVLASLLQLHGQGAAIQSDHQGISSLLNKDTDQLNEQTEGLVVDEGNAVELPSAIPAWFRRAWVGPYGGFRRGYVGPWGGFRRGWVGPGGGFRRAWGGPGYFRRGW
jgi:hypothetical protein